MGFFVIIQIYVIWKACHKNCCAILYLAVVIATGYIHLSSTWISQSGHWKLHANMSLYIL